eukprot:UN21375
MISAYVCKKIRKPFQIREYRLISTKVDISAESERKSSSFQEKLLNDQTKVTEKKIGPLTFNPFSPNSFPKKTKHGTDDVFRDLRGGFSPTLEQLL